MARRAKDTTAVENYDIVYRSPAQVSYDEEVAYAKEHGLKHDDITRCKFCNVIVKWADIKSHRKTIHDEPYGIERHTRYYSGLVYGQAQIVLIEPYGLSVDARKPSNGFFGGERFDTNHVVISAGDKDPDNYHREITMYLTIERARQFAQQILDATNKAENLT
jgi:hypothetical protein